LLQIAPLGRSGRGNVVPASDLVFLHEDRSLFPRNLKAAQFAEFLLSLIIFSGLPEQIMALGATGEARAKEDRNVLFSGRLHLSQFSDGRPCDIRLRRVVLAIDYRFCRSVSSPRHFCWIKAIWVIALILFSYVAILAYLIFQGRGMAERNVQQAQQARDELRRVVGFSVADEIQKLDGLKKAGSISDAEFARLRARLVQ
jgi:hypothetical protein